jgi:starvation-inducible outer membrane lipoprotein
MKSIIYAFLTLICVIFSACSIPPKLNQVSSISSEKPINSPEKAAEIKAKFEKN